jgi:chloramphenicol-sensitive protein RarD
MNDRRTRRLGVAYGLAAYLWWGFIALYFKAVATVPPLEVLAHRVLWSFVFLYLFLAARGRAGTLRATLRDGRSLALLGVTTVLIAVNWLVFITAVFHGHLLEASLGYFINPLVNVLLGVVWLAVGSGAMPWIALVLAFSFGTYGLLRKIARPDGLVGLAVETLLLAPAAVGWLLWSAKGGTIVFGAEGWGWSALLLAAGPVTALPLVWFAEGARRLRYATIGFLQYLAPSLQFLLAVVLFGERFTGTHAVTFILIWTALAVYSVGTYRSLTPNRSR